LEPLESRLQPLILACNSNLHACEIDSDLIPAICGSLSFVLNCISDSLFIVVISSNEKFFLVRVNLFGNVVWSCFKKLIEEIILISIAGELL
jgi:hypothetical protein